MTESNGELQIRSFISINESVDNNNLVEIILDKIRGDASRGACERASENEVRITIIWISAPIIIICNVVVFL